MHFGLAFQHISLRRRDTTVGDGFVVTQSHIVVVTGYYVTFAHRYVSGLTYGQRVGARSSFDRPCYAMVLNICVY